MNKHLRHFVNTSIKKHSNIIISLLNCFGIQRMNPCHVLLQAVFVDGFIQGNPTSVSLLNAHFCFQFTTFSLLIFCDNSQNPQWRLQNSPLYENTNLSWQQDIQGAPPHYSLNVRGDRKTWYNWLDLRFSQTLIQVTIKKCYWHKHKIKTMLSRTFHFGESLK